MSNLSLDGVSSEHWELTTQLTLYHGPVTPPLPLRLLPPPISLNGPPKKGNWKPHVNVLFPWSWNNLKARAQQNESREPDRAWELHCDGAWDPDEYLFTVVLFNAQERGITIFRLDFLICIKKGPGGFWQLHNGKGFLRWAHCLQTFTGTISI